MEPDVFELLYKQIDDYQKRREKGDAGVVSEAEYLASLKEMFKAYCSTETLPQYENIADLLRDVANDVNEAKISKGLVDCLLPGNKKYEVKAKSMLSTMFYEVLHDFKSVTKTKG